MLADFFSLKARENGVNFAKALDLDHTEFEKGLTSSLLHKTSFLITR